MSNFGQTQADDGTVSPGSPDSPKPHGDKLANAVTDAAGGGPPDQQAGSPRETPTTGDSPKPHGDKLSNAVQGTVSGGKRTAEW